MITKSEHKEWLCSWKICLCTLVTWTMGQFPQSSRVICEGQFTSSKTTNQNVGQSVFMIGRKLPGWPTFGKSFSTTAVWRIRTSVGEGAKSGSDPDVFFQNSLETHTVLRSKSLRKKYAAEKQSVAGKTSQMRQVIEHSPFWGENVTHKQKQQQTTWPDCFLSERVVSTSRRK